MATNSAIIGTALMAALAGGLNKPPANWTEVEACTAPNACQRLNQQGDIGNADESKRKITPQDFFRIVELAPKAVRSPEALKEPPAAADSLLHIKTGDGANYYFVGGQERFKDGSAQEIWNILRKYRGGAR